MIDESLPEAPNRLSQLKKNLLRYLDRLGRKLEKQEAERSETQKALWYRQIADSLLSLPPTATRGASQATICNIHTRQDEVVPLNPKLNLRENAALLYKKSKKAARGEEVNTKKVAETGQEIALCNKLLEAVKDALADPVTEPAEELIARIENALPRQIPRSTAPVPGRKEEKIPYRHYSIDDWDVYVGKNDRQNDELTTRFAKGGDLWFHVVGQAGSHLVIRRPDRNAAVPQDVITRVASLAVWFSKAKHTSYTEVHMTEARFVRKRRHSPPGQVIAERCKTIRVSPKSPQEMFPGKYEEDGET